MRPSDDERRLLVDWNDTYRPYNLERTLHSRIEEQAERTPDQIALIFEGHQVTYGELDQRSNQLARHLRQLGVGADTLVGLYIERSVEMVVGLLGVLKAGGAYVPVDPDYPQERVAFMLEDADATVLLTLDQYVGSVPSGVREVVCLDTDWEAIARHSSVCLEPSAGPDNLAYVIYTSGSTGRPKGAMITHRSICNRLLWMQDEYRLTRHDTVLQKTPFSFDVSVWEFFWPLLVGARLLIARPDGHKDPAYLARLINEEPVSVCHFVPSMLRAFLGEPNLRDRCTSLRHVICSGEELTRPLQDRFFAAIDAELHNLYGPTEAAIDVTHWTGSREWGEPVVPIGRPVANTQIHVLDPVGDPVAVGEVGELHIAGVQVARGYHRRPDLTAERFVSDPFSELLDARMYKSGDLARWRSDGNLEFLGRMDNQVKVRGVRIELGEIEAALESHPSVECATVLAREDVPGEKRLVAYVVPATASPLSLAKLRPHLQERLPNDMIPATLVNLDVMPVTENGKTDRKALPAPSRERPELGQAYLAPRNPVERYICSLWSKLLHIDGIGTRDRFFDLGGNSLLAAEFIRSLERELRENIYIVSIFDSPSIADYASFLARDYPAAVERRFGSAGRPATKSVATTRLDDADVETFRRCVPGLSAGAPAESSTRNPQALFVLAPPRSGTTLLRVMLAGHPDLFAAAELQLLGFHTLRERREAFSGKFSLWLEGTIRAVMELKECDATQAQLLMDSYEESGYTTKQFYAELQGWIGNRTLVDKSPSYALDRASLEKAERDFDDPLYIQLVRHPFSMVESFERYHMEQVLFLREHSFNPRQLGELVWLLSHENTNRFLERVPDGRKALILYEDLVADPERVLRGLCCDLGLEFHPDLADPYRDIETKMVDGIHAVSAPMGDTHFLEHGRIDEGIADRWKGVLANDFLSERTWQLAQQLGYHRAESSEQSSARWSQQRSAAQNRRQQQRQRRERRKRPGQE